MKKCLKSVKIWQNYGHESADPLFGPLSISIPLKRQLRTFRLINVLYWFFTLRRSYISNIRYPFLFLPAIINGVLICATTYNITRFLCNVSGPFLFCRRLGLAAEYARPQRCGDGVKTSWRNADASDDWASQEVGGAADNDDQWRNWERGAKSGSCPPNAAGEGGKATLPNYYAPPGHLRGRFEVARSVRLSVCLSHGAAA